MVAFGYSQLLVGFTAIYRGKKISWHKRLVNTKEPKYLLPKAPRVLNQIVVQ